jgi:catechol 2,3-dioxygenase-like lactoylglutathione lyase family enzyme
MASRENKEFKLRGVNHLALVCKDMAKTVDFYCNVLGMPLTKTIDLPGGSGQHFFFDIGNGDSLAFFWFPDAPDAAPGVAAPDLRAGQRALVSGHGSMNHVAFDVPADEIEKYRERLIAKGIRVTNVINHDNSTSQVSDEMNDDVFVRSIYFSDPDGILLEFASWTKQLGPDEAHHTPATPADREHYLVALEAAKGSS